MRAVAIFTDPTREGHQVKLTREAPSARVSGCLEQAELLHRHLCPRQVLGVRMGLYAGELLDVDLPRRDERLLVLVETDGCVADAISVATGCWLGHRTLRLIDHGKVAATFVDTVTRSAIRIWPDPSARIRALDYAPDAPDRWHAQRDGYQLMPTAALLLAQPVTLHLDLAAMRSRPGRRVMCEECGEDVINERQVVGEGRTLCLFCAGERYFTART